MYYIQCVTFSFNGKVHQLRLFEEMYEDPWEKQGRYVRKKDKKCRGISKQFVPGPRHSRTGKENPRELGQKLGVAKLVVSILRVLWT